MSDVYSGQLERGEGMNRWLNRRRRNLLRRKGASERALSTLFVQTEDHVELALTRYSERPSRRHPVIVCHGLGANRFTYDLSPELSLVRFLVEVGFDVYALELRGHGRSQKAGQGGLHYGWSLFDYAWRDLPAALEGVFDATGESQVHFVGHSMGGIVALAQLAAEKQQGPSRFRSLTTIGGAIDYSGTPSIFHNVRKLLPLTHLMAAVPIGPLASSFSSVALATPNVLDAANVNYLNVDRDMYRRLTAVGFHAVSSPVMRDLATCFEAGGLRDGERTYADLLPAATPTLAIAGTADIQCAPEAAGRPAHELRVFGKDHGTREEYGHFDLIMGKRARSEVWPTLTEWLVSHD